MDGFNEKKWFVYLVDHHEGPFSLAEIQAKLADKQVTATNYVWREGMGDWKVMTEVPEFDGLTQPVATTPAPTPVAPAESAPAPSEKTGKVIHLTAKGAGEKTSGTGIAAASATAAAATIRDPLGAFSQPQPELDRTPPLSTEIAAAAAIADQDMLAQIKPSLGQRMGRVFKLLSLTLVIAGAGIGYLGGYFNPLLHSQTVKRSAQGLQNALEPTLLALSEKVPALGKYISPIPPLEDVSPEEYEELKAAALAKAETGAATVSLALSRADLTGPAFYVASNLPDGSAVDLVIEGVSDTLLNQMAFVTTAKATLTKKLGKTATVRFEDGKLIPRGQYVVAVVANETAALASARPASATLKTPLAAGSKVVLAKTYFLGGVKDAVYTARLKEYHEKLMSKATAEVTEIKQFTTLLDSQLLDTLQRFSGLKKHGKAGRISALQKKSWSEFDSRWSKLDQQLAQTFSKWTPEAIRTDYFYGPLYSLTQQAGAALDRLHQLETSYFAGKMEASAFEIQHGEAVSVAQSQLNALKAKVEQAEKTPPTPNGMPQRLEI